MVPSIPPTTTFKINTALCCLTLRTLFQESKSELRIPESWKGVYLVQQDLVIVSGQLIVQIKGRKDLSKNFVVFTHFLLMWFYQYISPVVRVLSVRRVAG